MDFAGCPDDEKFGPVVQGCRDDFDFTIKFEKIFFSLIPASLLIAAALCRVVYLLRRPVIVGGRVLQVAKVATVVVYAALQFSLLLLSSINAQRFRALFVSSDTLSLASALCMLVLSFLEHSRSPRPSTLLSGYLFVTILFDIAQVRTFWLASTNSKELAFSRLSTCGVVIKALMILLEARSKSKWIIQWDVKEHSPEETTGLYGLGAYLWLNALFLKGYRKVLEVNDLYPLDNDMAAESLHARLSHHLDVSTFKGKKHGLAVALAKALAVPLILPVVPRVALGAFRFCQPFIIESLLKHLGKKDEVSPDNIGYGLIGATILVYVGIAVANAFYWYFQERVLYKARGLMAKAIYMKTTELKITASDDSAALTLMSTDIDRILLGFHPIHEFWANIIQVALACWLLSRQIGPSFVATLIVVTACFLWTAIQAKFAGPRQKIWMEKIQRRVGLTSTIIGQMKHLKISGLSRPIEQSIQALRVDELKASARYRQLMVFAAFIGLMPGFLSPPVTFAFASRKLDVTTIFTSLSYITLLTEPLGLIFQWFPMLVGTFTCLNRIQAFLEQDARHDYREQTVRGQTTVTAPADTEKSVDEGSPSASSARLIVRGGAFGWDPERPVLKDINFEIPASRLTIVIGPVASGKTTLCKALLGEVPAAHGHVSMLGPSLSSKIGYCDQNPYLCNETIRENIIGFRLFDRERYDEVIEATMLKPDLALLPQGDQTKIGSSGITLSGGQKQRVAIARALYLDTDFYIFDDILSGLDADTEKQVFLRVFSPSGLIRKRNATAVLCTHSVHHLPSADHIIVLGQDGTLLEQGTFQELMANDKYVSTLGVLDSSESNSEGSWATPKEDVAPSDGSARVLPAKTQLPVMSEAEARARMTGDWAVYRHYFARIGLLSKVTFIVGGVSWGFFLNFSTIWLKFWSEDVQSPKQSHSNAFWNGLYALFQMCAIFTLLVVAMIMMIMMVSISGAKLHQEALATVINAPLKFFATTDTGAVVNLFSQDMTLVDIQLPNAFVNLVLDAWGVIGMAAVIAATSPYLVITYPFLCAVLYVLQKFYLRTSRQMRLLDLEAKSPLYSHFIDTLKGIDTFRAFGWIQDSIAKNSKLLDTSQRPAYLLAMIQRWLAFTLEMIVALLAVAVVVLATQLRSNQALAGAGLVTLMVFGDNLTAIIRFYTQLETSIGAVSRLKSFGEKVESENRPGEDLVPPKEWPRKGEIEIKGVSASYGAADQEEDEKIHLALNDINLHISPGEKVAICGRSGSGKSSLLLLLLRLLDPTDTNTSTLTLDSLPLTRIPRSLLRDRLIAIPQEPVFLPSTTSTSSPPPSSGSESSSKKAVTATTIETNLDPDYLATREDCIAALQRVTLWDFISSRGGLDAQLATDTFSQGQKQLFSLARAIVRRRVRARETGNDSDNGGDGGVLLLDEVSSSVDRETEETMARVIAEEFKGWTVVMVSHRLGMVMRWFDRVVVMDKGGIVETGRPRELVEQEGSRFRELWLAQAGGQN